MIIIIIIIIINHHSKQSCHELKEEPRVHPSPTPHIDKLQPTLASNATARLIYIHMKIDGGAGLRLQWEQVHLIPLLVRGSFV